ncbi:MAG: hypothetical protein UX09_C0016G0014 [Candidatus Uhrbacteria bacterium GW2011_GWE2_45_35]|uniref:Uncharacterized protein n=2 Tax=Candidatus Uhriibacteriota TaxID=1752732 RepID=A0A0G1JK23_9BACT|nr:MAG: hypothetical protein UW63_C0009G0007 [Candidatus Uhrbacteria bacterium GW2011_GWF2_44_350]KKU08550.1 MAG: hypothetical protein UX09_C0016G0014 [Candidatus Uhrbacteria bacterium GW2011_GWE2_45_35]
MLPEIYCLMVAGGQLTPDLKEMLFHIALGMITEQTREFRLKEDGFEGVITTEFESTTLGGLSGTVFEAELDIGAKTVRMRYFVRPVRDAAILAKLMYVTFRITPRGLEFIREAPAN